MRTGFICIDCMKFHLTGYLKQLVMMILLLMIDIIIG